MASELIKHVSDASFEINVLQPGTLVLVDYWAEWWPCKMIAPSSTKSAGKYPGKLNRKDERWTKTAKPCRNSAFAAFPR